MYDILPVQMTDDGGETIDYLICVCDPQSHITVLEASLSDEVTSETGQPLPRYGMDRLPTYEKVRITEDMVGQSFDAANFQGVFDLESSIYLLQLETVPPLDTGIPYDIKSV